MFTGSYDNVVIRSKPEGAKVTVDGTYRGLTPVTVALRRDHDHNVALQKDGYQESVATVTRHFNYVALANLINPICYGIDYATGGIWNFDQTELNVTLDSRAPASTY